MSNAACNNTTFSSEKLPGMEEMHQSAARLYEIAKEATGTVGKSALARVLNESPQVVNNWERRGVSEGGALKAQAAFGCDANWLLTGEGTATLGWPFKRVPLASFLALDPDDRAFVEGKLAQAIEGLGTSSSADAEKRLKQSSIPARKSATKRHAA